MVRDQQGKARERASQESAPSRGSTADCCSASRCRRSRRMGVERAVHGKQKPPEAGFRWTTSPVSFSRYNGCGIALTRSVDAQRALLSNAAVCT